MLEVAELLIRGVELVEWLPGSSGSQLLVELILLVLAVDSRPRR